MASRYELLRCPEHPGFVRLSLVEEVLGPGLDLGLFVLNFANQAERRCRSLLAEKPKSARTGGSYEAPSMFKALMMPRLGQPAVKTANLDVAPTEWEHQVDRATAPRLDYVAVLKVD